MPTKLGSTLEQLSTVISCDANGIKNRIKHRGRMLEDNDVLFFSLCFSWAKKRKEDEIVIIDPLNMKFMLDKTKTTDKDRDRDRAISIMKQRLCHSFKNTSSSESNPNTITIFPVNHDLHWSLLVYFKSYSMWYHFDSMEGCHINFVQKILLKTMASHRLITNKNDKFKSIRVPYQKGGWECGLHMLMFIYIIISTLQKPEDKNFKACDSDGMEKFLKELNDMFQHIVNNVLKKKQ